MHGYFPYGMAFFNVLYVVVVGGGLYLLYSISKSLKRIAEKSKKIDQV
ncbi:hypothetical protein SPSIL_057400 [Sporomusa silvacetica DSM 10669]|uniref:CcmD family protein n=1 Tax=Sporomusa silvacetica DSM 10669 TaxID=1123289 RepID=A0ABZ3IUV0_9FIRM|nr:hypothetical protein SPSIL_42390 [Sporomusa silvacetica DSM 10669]